MKYIMLLTMLFSVLAGPQGFAQTATQAQNTDTQYLPNAGFENGKAGWVTYKTTAQALPTTGQGGTATSTLTTSTTTPISGKASGILTHPASSVQGEGISMPFSLDKDARGQVMQIRGKYEIVSGTYSGGSGLPTPTDSDLEVYVYDVDAGQLIQPTAYKLDGGVIGNTYIINANFQASNTSSNYRLIFHYATTSANAFVVRLDALKVSNSIKTFGVPAYDWTAFTPTGSWTTNTTYTGRMRRMGDTAEIQYKWSLTGAPNNVQLSLNMPSGLSIDTTKLITAGPENTVVSLPGTIVRVGTLQYEISALYNSATTINLAYVATPGNTNPTAIGIANALTGTAPSSFASGDGGNITIRVPIAGWSSNVQMSDTSGDNRVIAFRGTTTATTSIGTTAAAIPFTAVTDTTSSWNGSAYIVPSPGTYRISPSLLTTLANLTATQNFQVMVYKNGVEVYHALKNGAGSNAYLNVTGSTELLCNSGDSLQVYAASDVATSLYSSATYNTVSISKISGNTQTAIGESVNATYGLTTAQSVAANTIVKYDTKNNDSHSAYSTSTGLFTCPVNGMYRTTVTASATSGGASPFLKLNGAVGPGYFFTVTGTNLGFSGSVSTRCLAGQTLGVYYDGAITLGAPATNGTTNTVVFEKTGN